MPVKLRLWIEFLTLYVGAPLALLFYLPTLPRGSFWYAILALMIAGVVLLAITPNWRWRELWRVRGIEWRWVLVFTLGTIALLVPLAWWWNEERFLYFLDNPNRLRFLLFIWVMYPWVSALGQEIAYRALFFRRYGDLFPNRWVAVAVNGAVFAFAHVIFENWLVGVLTLMAGLIWAEAYSRNQNFPQAFIAHSIGGNLVFASGLGWEFCYGCGRFVVSS